MKRVRGIQASPGIAIGPVFLHDPGDIWVNFRRISEEEVSDEVKRFLDTLQEVAEDVKVTREHLEQQLGRSHAQIFDAHLLILEDSALKEPTIDLIEENRFDAAYAFSRTLQNIARQFDAIEDDLFRARKTDILDIERRVLNKLSQTENVGLEQLTTEAIVVAHDLTTSDTAHMQRDCVLGFITEVGGTMSHTSIIARGLEIPAVVGVKGVLSQAQPGAIAIVDGKRGMVILDPDPNTLERYGKEAEEYLAAQGELASTKDLPAVTLDGSKISLQVNIELPEEMESALSYGAEGVGLYRTEFLYLAQEGLPTEEDQTETYSKLAGKIPDGTFVIRTLDLGGDKLAQGFQIDPEVNPFLGWRAIRLSLANLELFRSQLRAILRASNHGNVRIMFPMISGVEELLKAKEVLEEAKEDLRTAGEAFDEECLVGAMIEVPSAAVLADQLAEEVDFFSIGTNDLIQYTIAVDRGNEKVAYLFDPLHPGVLRLIKGVVEAGHARGVPVTVCGEMAGNACCGLILIGLGVDTLSMSPRFLSEVKQAIRSVTLDEAKKIADAVLSLRTRDEIREYLKSALPDCAQDVPEPTIEEEEAEASSV